MPEDPQKEIERLNRLLELAIEPLVYAERCASDWSADYVTIKCDETGDDCYLCWRGALEKIDAIEEAARKAKRG